MDYLKKLIKLFSEFNVSDIEANSGQILKDKFGDDLYNIIFCPDAGEESDFSREHKDNYDKVVRLKTLLENIIKSSPDHKEQIYDCLFILNTIKEDEGRKAKESIELLGKLIQYTLYEKKWDASEKKLYDSTYDIIVNCKDYFISYTNRDAASTNDDFKELITRIGESPNEKEEREANFVARIIAKFLRQNNLRGFYDYKSLKCGDDIAYQIREKCQKSFTFIQLLENQSFAEPEEDKNNWCLEEYNEFKNNNIHPDFSGERFYFLITSENIKDLEPSTFPATYKVWFEHAKELLFISLEKYQQLDATGKASFRKDIRNLADEIKKTKTQIINSILDA